MSSMRTLAIFWISGMIAGMILMERWRRHGADYVPMQVTAPDSALDAASSADASRPNLVGLVVTGAKLDAQRVKTRVGQIRPSQTA